MLRLFLRRALMDVEMAHGMLAWPHSGFHVHDGVWVAADDCACAVLLARYCARNPVALSRLEYQRDNATVTLPLGRRGRGSPPSTAGSSPTRWWSR